jgi:signal transduction histidine kinase
MSASTKERLRIAVVVVLTAFSLILYFLIYYVWKNDVPFRFVYFLPSLLACLWWGRKGIPLTLFLAVALPLLLVFSPVEARLWDDIVGSLVILAAILVIAELSERRTRLIATLEEQVEQRTAQLSERNQELEAYGHTISHDLLGPVTLIKGYATIARENLPQEACERERENLGKIIDASDRMTRLTTSLLEYAKAGNPEGEIERVDSGEALRSVLQDMEARIDEAGGRVYVAPDLPAVMADPLKLRQVFSNLLGNAVKFRVEERPLKIGIGYEVEEGTVTFDVRDNGEGMGAEQVGEIFEPFKRFSHDDSPGGGIGLATVRRAVEAWGGSIQVESVPGKGTVFYFTVPAGMQDPRR